MLFIISKRFFQILILNYINLPHKSVYLSMDYLKGRGAQIKTGNRFLKNEYVTEHIEGLDEELLSSPTTQIFHDTPKK